MHPPDISSRSQRTHLPPDRRRRPASGRAERRPPAAGRWCRSPCWRGGPAIRPCAPPAAARRWPPRAHRRSRRWRHPRVKVERRAIGGVVRGDDDGAAAAAHAVAVEVGARRVGQHHARPVVAREHQRPLDRARREHHLLRAHLPQPLARQARVGVGQMVGDALRQPDQVVREIAEGGGARQQRRRAGCAPASRPCPRAIGAPACPRLWPRCRRAASRRAPPARRTGSRARRHRPRPARRRGRPARRRPPARRNARSGSVAVGIGQRRGAAEAGHRADERLVERAPRPFAAT